MPDPTDPILTTTFTAEGLCALDALLSLVHYDGLAKSWVRLLPEDLREAMGDKVWLGEPCTYDFAHTRQWCGNPRCRES